jgi:hypothetical protein
VALASIAKDVHAATGDSYGCVMSDFIDYNQAEGFAIQRSKYAWLAFRKDPLSVPICGQQSGRDSIVKRLIRSEQAHDVLPQGRAGPGLQCTLGCWLRITIMPRLSRQRRGISGGFTGW